MRTERGRGRREEWLGEEGGEKEGGREGVRWKRGRVVVCGGERKRARDEGRKKSRKS